MIIISYDRLEDKFLSDVKPYWKLYAGQGKNESKCFAANTSNENIHESFDMLNQQLDFSEDRYITVLTKNSPNARNGLVYVIDRGDNFGANTIGGMRQQQPMLPQMGGMVSYQQALTIAEKLSADKIAAATAEIKREYEVKELKQLIQDMRDSPPTSFSDRFMDLLEIHGGQWGQALFGPNNQLKQPVAGVPAADIDEETEESEYVAPKQISIDKMVYDLGRIQQALPDQNANELLHKLANLAQNNPNQLRGLIPMLG